MIGSEIQFEFEDHRVKRIIKIVGIVEMSEERQYDEVEKVWWEKEAENDGKRAVMSEKRFVSDF